MPCRSGPSTRCCSACRSTPRPPRSGAGWFQNPALDLALFARPGFVVAVLAVLTISFLCGGAVKSWGSSVGSSSGSRRRASGWCICRAPCCWHGRASGLGLFFIVELPGIEPAAAQQFPLDLPPPSLRECGGVVADRHSLDRRRIPAGLASGGGDSVGHQPISDRLECSARRHARR